MAQEETDIGNNEMEVKNADDQETTSIFAALKDPVYRNKFLRWLCIPIGNLTLGIVDSQGGPTIRDVQIITSTNKETASFFFTAYNLGYFLGSLVGGFCHGKINSYMMMMLGMVLAGVTDIASPYCSTFVLMFLIRTFVGFFLGVFLCVSNTEHMRIWGTNGEALLQLINCVYAVGGVFGPLIAEPFISEKETENKTLSLTGNKTSSLTGNTTWSFTENTNFSETESKISWSQNFTFSPFINITETSNSTLPQTTNVHYAFLIGGLILIVSATQCLVSFLMPNTSTNKDKDIGINEESVDRKLPRKLKVIMLGAIFLFYFTYCCVEIVFSAYIMTFVVDEYDEVSTEQGDYITTFFWASFAVARFVAIFTSKYVAAIRLLYVHLSLVTLALSGFLVSAIYSRIDLLTGFTCVLGVACSAIFPAGISWVEAEIMTVSGPVSAVILVGASFGAMIVPFVVGHLMENVSNFWFCYSLIIALGLALSLFAFLLSLNKLYVNKKYGKFRESARKERQNGVPEIHVQTEL